MHDTQKITASGNVFLPLKFHSLLVYNMAARFCRLCSKLKNSGRTALRQKLVVLQLFNKFPPIYESRMLISVFIAAFIYFLSPQNFSHSPPFFKMLDLIARIINSEPYDI
jgi:hypothetical protein